MLSYINARIAELHRINKEDSNLLDNAPPGTNIPREAITNVLKLRRARIDELELLKSHLETLKTQKVWVAVDVKEGELPEEDKENDGYSVKVIAIGEEYETPFIGCFGLHTRRFYPENGVYSNHEKFITHWLKQTLMPCDFDEKFVIDFVVWKQKEGWKHHFTVEDGTMLWRKDYSSQSLSTAELLAEYRKEHAPKT